jgi:hypothetical protein
MFCFVKVHYTHHTWPFSNEEPRENLLKVKWLTGDNKITISNSVINKLLEFSDASEKPSG